MHFGDCDALWLLAHFAEHHPALKLVWLDSFSACKGVREAPQRVYSEYLPVRTIFMAWGVNDAKTAAIALRSARRNI